MSARLFDLNASLRLSDERQLELITAAQDVPTEDLGDGRVVYRPTPEAEVALDELTTAFLPALRKAAMGSRTLQGDEDAFGVVLTEFVAAVRAHDVDSPIPFSRTIAALLRNKVADADSTSDLVAVPDAVAARYRRLMSRHDYDAAAAYRECQAHTASLSPSSFLAVHAARSFTDSLDLAFTDDSTFASRVESALEDRADKNLERFITDDLVAYLFAQLDDRQETVLRHRFGFVDDATETSVLTAGLRPGDELTDEQIAHATHLSRATVNRLRKSGLDDARGHLVASLAGEE